MQNYKKNLIFAYKPKVNLSIMRHILTKHPISCFIFIIIWLLCFIDIPETPLSDVTLIDKWTHIVMYLVLCCTFWIEEIILKTKIHIRRMLIWTGIIPIFMGGLIEILQAYCTGGRRSGEWLDFVADCAGVFLAQFIGILLVKCLSTLKKGE